jgi:hypothetical protein
MRKRANGAILSIVSTRSTVLIADDGSEGGADALALGRLLLDGIGGRALVASVVQIPSHLLGGRDLETTVRSHAEPLFEVARDRLAALLEDDNVPGAIARARSGRGPVIPTERVRWEFQWSDQPMGIRIVRSGP